MSRQGAQDSFCLRTVFATSFCIGISTYARFLIVVTRFLAWIRESSSSLFSDLARLPLVERLVWVILVRVAVFLTTMPLSSSDVAGVSEATDVFVLKIGETLVVGVLTLAAEGVPCRLEFLRVLTILQDDAGS